MRGASRKAVVTENDESVQVITDRYKVESGSVWCPQWMPLFGLLVSVPWENDWDAH